MDDKLQELLVGVAANGLSDLLSRARSGRSNQVPSDVTEKAVEAAIAELTSVEEIHPGLGGENFRRFLLSPEAGLVIRQLYGSNGQPKSRQEIEQEFLGLWEIRVGADEVPREELKRLFQSLISLCDTSLERALDAGSLNALNAKMTQNTGELSGALAGIERTVKLLQGAPGLNHADVEEFAEQYRRQVASREGSITPPALDGARQVPIDDLYVPARFDVPSGSDSPPWTYQFFVGQMFRGVVLGNPGSGKSTLAKKFVTDLARDRIASPRRQPGLVPFLVTLRDFGAQKQVHPCSVVDFIASTSNSRYQLSTSSDIIEYLLLTNRALVIFDGLDELLDTRDRAEISGDVASFANLYPATPILVTSREVGYLEAPLPDDHFPTYRLAEFGEGEVREYAQKWFRLADGNHTGSPREDTATFMRDSAGVADLRSNALLLGLMCNLYKGAGYIPRNRPDVYEACAEMLFDRWDRLRQIGEPLNIESLMRPAMQHLASWIYGDNELQSGVTEKALIAEAASYLHDRRFDDIDDARLAARKFIEHCRGRAWVFTDTGTTGTGERLYQFTHRTFLEFFTAGHLVRTNPAPDRLLETLWPRISVQEWDVVAQLCFQLLEHNVDGAGTEMLREIASEPPNLSDSGRVNRLNFAVRCLEFLVPAPSVARELTRNCTALFAEWIKRRGIFKDSDRAIITVLALLKAGPENAVPVRGALTEELVKMIGDPTQAVPAAELALNLGVVAVTTYEEVEAAREVTAKVAESSSDRLREIGMSDAALGSDLVLKGMMSFEEFIATHGIEPVLRERRYQVFEQAREPSLGERVVAALLRGGNDFEREEARVALRVIAKGLASTPTPWHSEMPDKRSWLFRSATQFGPPPGDISMDDLAAEERFAAVALAAAYIDLMGADLSRDSVDRRLRELALEDGAPAWETVISILRAKVENAPEIGLTTLISLRLEEPQELILQAWMADRRLLVAQGRARV